MEHSSTHESIQAYDIPERVTEYDSDMDLMHPNRAAQNRPDFPLSNDKFTKLRVSARRWR